MRSTIDDRRRPYRVGLDPAADLPKNGAGAKGAADEATRVATESNWRHRVISEALLCRERDGSPEFCIIRALHEHRPEWATRTFWDDVSPTLAAFRRLIPDLETCVEPALIGATESAPFPAFGWWRGVFPEDGQQYEIVLAPDYSTLGDWLVAGPHADGVEALTQAVIADPGRHAIRFEQFSDGSWEEAPELAAEVDRTTWDDIILAPALKHDIRQAVNSFFENRDVYKRMGFAWRRGILLVGPPGTGKTMVARAVAHSRPDFPFLYVRDLAPGRHHGDADALAAIFNRARRLAPCIVSIEDMDGLISDTNRTTFLNELDGFKDNDGLLIIASSNHPEKIDDALMKRPSRFDRVFTIGLPEEEERAAYVHDLLDRGVLAACAPADIKRLAATVAAATAGFTPALLKEAILSALLEQAQNGDANPSLSDVSIAVAAQVEWLRQSLRQINSPRGMRETVGGNAEIGFRARR